MTEACTWFCVAWLLTDAKCSFSSTKKPELVVFSESYSAIYGQGSFKLLQLPLSSHKWWLQGRSSLVFEKDGLYSLRSLSCIIDAPKTREHLPINHWNQLLNLYQFLAKPKNKCNAITLRPFLYFLEIRMQNQNFSEEQKQSERIILKK